jgi:histidine-specific SAM-dependent methyltransferase
LKTIDQKWAYSGTDAAGDFYATRLTDGNRPAIYSDLLADAFADTDLLVSLGCGDSAVEATLQRAVLKPGAAYLGVDIASSMLARSQTMCSKLQRTIEFVDADFRDPRFMARMRPRLEAVQNPVVALFGRTFGNLEPADLLSSLKPLVEVAPLFFDCYGGQRSGMLLFAQRMADIALASRTFFMNGARRCGIQIDESELVETRFTETAHWYTCQFVVNSLDLELFSIRYFFSDDLAHIAEMAGYRLLFHRAVNQQILPMRLVGVQTGCR